jgi:basic amino acid/polyamine antiporter, APA family
VTQDDQPAEPARVLGPLDTTAVVVGAIVGVGIFFTPSKVAALVGSAPLVMLAWALAGVIVLCGALVFAELGGLHHASGAQYGILRQAYGPFPAFLYVFCNATAIQAGAIGFIAWICAANLGVAATGAFPGGKGVVAVAGVLIAVVAVINVAGVRLGARVQNATAIFKVLALLAVTALAAFTSHPAEGAAAAAAPAASPALAVLSALVPAFFTYGGWQQALWVAGEVRDPRRNLPRAIVGGVVLVVIVYLLTNWAYLRLLGASGVAQSRALATDAVASVLPAAAGRVVAAAVAVSAFGVLNAQLLTGPRLVHGMARDGRFFPVFGQLGRQTGTPAAAITLIAATAIILLMGSGPEGVDKLYSGVVFIDGIFFALTGAALFVLRRKLPDADRPVRVPLYPIVPAVFVLGEIGVVAGAYLSPGVRGAAWIGIAWMAGGALLYAVRFRERG